MNIRFVLFFIILFSIGCGVDSETTFTLEKKKQAQTLDPDQVQKKLKWSCSSERAQKAKELCKDKVFSNYVGDTDVPVGDCIQITVYEAKWNNIYCTCSYSEPETTIVGECTGG